MYAVCGGRNKFRLSGEVAVILANKCRLNELFESQKFTEVQRRSLCKFFFRLFGLIYILLGDKICVSSELYFELEKLYAGMDF